MMKNTKQIKEVLGDIFDTFSSKDGVYTIKKSYYWGVTKDGSHLGDRVKEKFPNAFILDWGNHWHSFVGGAKSGSAQDSYWFCKFKLI
jgi:hypothetical protein